jgi:hypothetical protein
MVLFSVGLLNLLNEYTLLSYTAGKPGKERRAPTKRIISPKITKSTCGTHPDLCFYAFIISFLGDPGSHAVA